MGRPRSQPETCTVRGCGEKSLSRGYCNKHYHKWRKYGDATASASKPRWTPPSGSPPAPRTDARAELIAATMDVDVRDVAAYLGLTTASVYQLRRHQRAGTTDTRGYTAEEDEFIISESGRLTEQQIADYLARSRRSVAKRKTKLRADGVLGTVRHSKDPCHVGRRRLLAKTCYGCGLLLNAEFYFFRLRSARHGSGWSHICERCRGQGFNRSQGKARHSESTSKLQKITKKYAYRNNMPYEDGDLSIMAETDTSYFEKALRMQRTYTATASACRRAGFISVPRKDYENGQWVIELMEGAAS